MSPWIQELCLLSGGTSEMEMQKAGRKGDFSKLSPPLPHPFHPYSPVVHSLTADNSRKHYHDGA